MHLSLSLSLDIFENQFILNAVKNVKYEKKKEKKKKKINVTN